MHQPNTNCLLTVYMQYFQTLIEILFANIDINGHVLACLLSNLAANTTFQDKLCAEIAAHPDDTSFNINYAVKQDTLLHCLTLESVRLLSSVCKCHRS